ncbi:MAG: hypothetical protein GON13_01175 [Nanoarchaeota archaeon]|nr:hypothetical protein [Nanoarchaeota archaeon]
MKKSFGKKDYVIIFSYILVFLAGLLFPRNIYYSETQELPILHLSNPFVLKSSFSVVAVNNAGFGSVGNISVEILAGSGRVLLNTNPFVETDTQVSVEIAKQVAESVCGYSLNDKDIIVTFDIDGVVVGGHSAGAATAVTIIAAVLEKELNDSVALTGTIDFNGNVGNIDGLIGKAQAVGEAGKELFLIPKGQNNITYYEREVVEEEILSGFVFRSFKYVPKFFDLNNYTQAEWNLTVVEVSNISEVLFYILNS